MNIITCDKEWSHDELYGIAYDNCMHACEKLDFLLDNPNLAKPNILMETVANTMGDHHLVDKYNALYASKEADETSDDVFNKWDLWIQNTIKEILLAHKYKYYIGGR